MTRLLLCLIAAVLAVSVAADIAQAGINFHYSSGPWNVAGSFGYPYYSCYGYPYSYYPYYGYYGYPYRPYVQHYPTLPVWNLGNGLPYVPVGTIFTFDRPSRYYGYYGYSGYPYSYYSSPYGYYGTGSFAGAYLATAPQVGSERIISGAANRSSSSSSPQVVNNITVQVAPPTAGAATPQVAVQQNGASWRRGLWTVPVPDNAATAQPAAASTPVTATSAATNQPPATAATPAPTAPPVQLDTEASYVYTLLRGTDAQRLKAATELKRFNTPTSVDTLIDALARDGLATVRQQAARSLGAMLARLAHEPLWKAAREDPDAGVRTEARDAALKIEAAR